MGLLAFVAAPTLIARSTMTPGLVYWMLLVVGMVWQFVVSLTVLRLELKTLRWEVLKDRLWVTRPRHPKTGRPGLALWLWIIPALAANAVGGFLALRPDAAWLDGLEQVMDPRLIEPADTTFTALDDPSLEGQWWILGLALTSARFDYVLGEELLFAGCCCRAWRGVFGRWDWVANTVLFGPPPRAQDLVLAELDPRFARLRVGDHAIPIDLDGRDHARARVLLPRHRARHGAGDRLLITSGSTGFAAPSGDGET